MNDANKPPEKKLNLNPVKKVQQKLDMFRTKPDLIKAKPDPTKPKPDPVKPDLKRRGSIDNSKQPKKPRRELLLKFPPRFRNLRSHQLASFKCRPVCNLFLVVVD